MTRSLPVKASEHSHSHAFRYLNPLVTEGLSVASRRNLLKSSLLGMAGLSLPQLLQAREPIDRGGLGAPKGKSVILLWMTGGPSQIDTWDPKPERPPQNRGPFGVIPTKLPGVIICEHLPKQAAMMDRFTILRSVDAKSSNHEPNTVFQTGNLEAEPRTNPEAVRYPSIASVIAKHHGSHRKGIPPNIGFYRSKSHIAFAGDLGQQFDPFPGNLASKLPIYDLIGTNTGKSTAGEMFRFAKGLSFERMADRRQLLADIDTMRRDLDQSRVMEAMDAYNQQAFDLLLGPETRQAFDLSLESKATRERYGDHLWCQQALLARRLVESGSAFVTLDLSYHTASGTWDNHGDNIPPYGGISKGLKPLLPLFDHLLTTLVSDLEERGKLDDVLVIAMGEFGRTPMMGTQGSTDGRDHWPNVMSMVMAGGGLRHGQVIGSTDKDGGSIRERAVTPGDLAATLYRYFGVPLDTQYVDSSGRPRNVVNHGAPISELGI